MPDENALSAPAGTEGSAPPQPISGEEPAPVVKPEEESTTPPDVPAPAPLVAAQPKEPTAAEKRIAQLVAKQREAEREAAYWRGQAEAKKGEPAPTIPTSVIDQPPKVDDFQVYDDYLIARSKYEFRQELKAEQVKKEQEQERLSNVDRDRRFFERMEKAAETDPDLLTDFRDPSLPVSAPMADLIKDSECAPQLVRYLLSNRAEAAKIAQLGPLAAAKEIGKLETKLTATSPTVPTKTISQAPEPIKPIISAGPVSVDLEKMPVEEFMKARNAKQFGTRR